MRNYAQHGTHRTGLPTRLTIVLVLLFILAGTVNGQNTVGSIVGTATSNDGSAIAGVTITITNEGTHAARTLTTGEHGEYAAPDLNPGSYDLRATAPGFTSMESQGIVVLSQQTVRIDIPLKVGSVASQVVVTGATPVIENEMPSISTTVTAEEITQTSSNLLGTKDNTGDSGLEEYIALLPAGHNGSGSSWSMNGSTTGEAYYNVDGISSNSTLYGNADGPAFPSYDIVQEVKYDSVNNKAEMGQLLNITVITKSGTDNFHGSLFEHFGNQDLQAQSYFSQTNPPYTDNDFGGGVGGPIRKRKFYFFAAYEGLRNNLPLAISPNVPTTNFRTGNFSSLLSTATPIVIYNPYTGQAFPNNVIPSSLLQSAQGVAAQKYQAMFYPAPNYGSADSFSTNFRGTYPQHIYSNRFDLRLDGNLSPANTAFVRFSYNRASPETLVTGLPPSIAGYNVQIRKTYSGVLSDTWALTPNLFNLAKVGAEWTNNNFRPTLLGQGIMDTLGIQGLPVAPATAPGFPGVSISSFTAPYQQGPANGTEQTNQVVDQLTYQRRNHTIKGGVEYRPQFGTQPVYPNFGTYTYNGSQTGNGKSNTGFAYADFLLGLPQSTGYTYISPSQYQRAYFLSGFVQDDWRVRPNLMFSFGVRYDFDSAPKDKFDTIANFDPATGAIVVPSLANVRKYIAPGFPASIPILSAQQAHFPGSSLRNPYKTALYPRLGFAYNVNPDTVLRGGYGIYNNDLTGEMITGLYQAPYGGSIGYTNSAVPYASTPAITFTNPTNAATGKLGAISVNGLDKDLRNPYVQQWNLTLEQNIGFGTGLRISYVGLHASDLIYGRNLNQVHASATVPWSQANTAYPNFQKVIQRSNGGIQTYNGLTAEVDHRMRRNLLFDASLTWAKNLTNDPGNAVTGNSSFFPTDAELGVVSEDTYNFARQRGNDQYTPRLQFTSNVLYTLPVGPGQMLLHQDNLLTKIVGGWQLSTSYEQLTGQFLTPVFGGIDPTNINAFGGTANRVAGVSTQPTGGRSIINWYNHSSYAVPQAGQFGNAGFGTLVGPGSRVLNAALFKSVPMPRETKIDISGSFSNVLNHPNLADPDMTITDANAGRITGVQSYYWGPRSGLVSVRYTF
jgi:Carboxypeptidase regulatory-like domain/TonB dependent receptor